MKIKYKLTLIGIAMTVTVAVAITIGMLSRARNISIELSVKGLEFLNEQQSEYWNGRINSHVRALRTLAHVMAGYESLDPEERRDTYDEMLRNVLEAEEVFFLINTIWKPNAIDGLDAQMIGRSGSTSTGQYAISFSREEGRDIITWRTTAAASIDDIMAHMNGPRAREDRIETPFYRMVWGEDAYLFRISVPITNPRTNEVVGMISCLVDLVMVQPTVEQLIEANPDIAAMSIYANDGFIIASYIPDNIGFMLHEVNTMFGDNLDVVQDAVSRGEALTIQGYSPVLRSNTEINFSPFYIGNSNMSWTIMLAKTDVTIMAPVRIMTNFAIIIAAAVILVGSIIAFFLYQFMTSPIVKVTGTLQDIAQGEGDLTQVIDEKGNDEISSMAHYFNLTIGKIKTLVMSIGSEANELSGIGLDLSNNMGQTAAAMNQIAANIQSIKNQMVNQSTSVNETNATMENITSNISKLNGYVETQANSVSHSSSAIEEMLANINSVTDTLIKNSENVDELTSASEVGRSGLFEVSADIQEIAKESEGLLEINSVMENIASQTNLLSMNAAIEAAHAGEAGRGFAVVADEIRKLAVNSGEQSKTISNVLKKIKTSIDKITHSTENVLKRFEAIDSGIKTVAQQEENIRYAMEEQGQGSKQILESIGQVNEVTKLVQNVSLEMLEGAKEVIRESESLAKATQEISGGINEMATGADEVNTAVNHVNELSDRNRESIGLLTKEVSRFKVE